MATLKIEFGKLGTKGTLPVYILLVQGSSKKRIPTGIVLKSEEITPSGKIKNHQKEFAIEQIRRKYQDKLESLYTSIIDWRNKDASTLVELLTTSKRKPHEIDFFEFADEWMKNSKVKGIKNYVTMINTLKSYYSSPILPFKKIDYNFLVGFERYLSGKPRAQSLYIGLLRHLYREAMRRYNTGVEPIITNDPFIAYRAPKQKIRKGVRSITQEELMKVYDYVGRPHSRAQLARDCFILSFCLMGINSVDLYECAVLKNNTLCYNRAKTKDRREDEAYIEVNIHPFIRSLVKKYKSSEKDHVFNFSQRYKSPIDFNRALNIGLKEIGKDVGIQDLQFYQARHTFATLSRNLMKFSKGDVDEALNHIGSFDIADIYIKKDFSIINENNFKLLDTLFSNAETNALSNAYK